MGEYDPALFTGSVTDSFASYGDVAVVTLSRFATEGNDLAMVNDKGKRMLELDDNEKAIFQQIKDSGKFKKTVVLLNSVFAMEMDWLDECVEGEMPRYDALEVKSRFLLGVNGLDRYKDEPR